MKIKVLKTSGTHYEVGHEIGKAFRENIVEALDVFVPQCKANLEFIESNKGKEVLAGYKAVAEETYPQYVEEIQGMANGAGISENKIWVINLCCELYRNSNNSSSSIGAQNGHCSDILVNNADMMVSVHNEDAFAAFKRLSYIVSAHITDDKPRGKFWAAEEKFTAYCWPGILPGYCFGFNSNGITHTINTLFPLTLLENRTPVAMLVRAALVAKSFENLEEIFRDEGHGMAFGISLNSGCSRSDAPKILCNFEVAANPERDCSIVKKTVIGPSPDCDVKRPYFHANAYKHINTERGKAYFCETSYTREKYFNDFLPPASLQDVLSIIGYQGPTGEKLKADSIYNVSTIATGVFDFKARTLTVYSDNPKTSKPEHVFQMPSD